MPRDLLRAALAGSSIIELRGIIIIFTRFATTLRRAHKLGPAAPIRIAGASFALAANLNPTLYVSITTALSNTFLFPASWDDALTHRSRYGFIVPIAIAIAIRNFSMFMRVAAPPKRELLPLALVYVTGLIGRLNGLSEQVFVNHHTFNALGVIRESGAWI